MDYTDVVGHPQQLRLSGDAAALVQHEIDHLDGIFFLDKVADTKTVASVESVYAANPARLAQVRDMIDYMHRLMQPCECLHSLPLNRSSKES